MKPLMHFDSNVKRDGMQEEKVAKTVFSHQISAQMSRTSAEYFVSLLLICTIPYVFLGRGVLVGNQLRGRELTRGLNQRRGLSRTFLVSRSLTSIGIRFDKCKS